MTQFISNRVFAVLLSIVALQQQCAQVRSSNGFFCGESYLEARTNCRARCPTGSHVECPDGTFCYAGLASCDYYCGSTWFDATQTCATRCMSGKDYECPWGTKCFADTTCGGGDIVELTSNVQMTLPGLDQSMEGTDEQTFEQTVFNFLEERIPGIDFDQVQIVRQSVKQGSSRRASVKRGAAMSGMDQRKEDAINSSSHAGSERETKLSEAESVTLGDRVMQTSSSALDVVVIITGEYRPPPYLNLDSLVEDSINTDAATLVEDLQEAPTTNFFQQLETIEAEAIPEIPETASPSSSSPTSSPSLPPTSVPSLAPSTLPSASPSREPSAHPSKSPGESPSNAPSHRPSDVPTDQPSISPSDEPSSAPSIRPTNIPTYSPSGAPSAAPSQARIQSLVSDAIFGSDEYTTDSHGILFNLRTTTEGPSVLVTGLDFYTDQFDTVVYELWTKEGTYDGYRGTFHAWTKAAGGSVQGQGIDGYTSIPPEDFRSVPIRGGGATQAFYLTLSSGRDLQYQVGDGADSDEVVQVVGPGLELYEGEGVLVHPFAPDLNLYRKPRKFLGSIHYDRNPCHPFSQDWPCPTLVPSVAPSLSPTESWRPSFSPSVSSEPSLAPSEVPSRADSQTPSLSVPPSDAPSILPSVSARPSKDTDKPTGTPTKSATPTNIPSRSPLPYSNYPESPPTETPRVSFEATMLLLDTEIPSDDALLLEEMSQTFKTSIDLVLPTGSTCRIVSIGGIPIPLVRRRLDQNVAGAVVKFEVSMEMNCASLSCADETYSDVTSSIEQAVADGTMSQTIRQVATDRGLDYLKEVRVDKSSFEAHDLALTSMSAAPTTAPTKINAGPANPQALPSETHTSEPSILPLEFPTKSPEDNIEGVSSSPSLAPSQQTIALDQLTNEVVDSKDDKEDGSILAVALGMAFGGVLFISLVVGSLIYIQKGGGKKWTEDKGMNMKRESTEATVFGSADRQSSLGTDNRDEGSNSSGQEQPPPAVSSFARSEQNECPLPSSVPQKERLDLGGRKSDLYQFGAPEDEDKSLTSEMTLQSRGGQSSEDFIGRRLRVRFANEKYYAGVIYTYKQKTKKHVIQFDDGDVREYNLNKKTFLWENAIQEGSYVFDGEENLPQSSNIFEEIKTGSSQTQWNSGSNTNQSALRAIMSNSSLSLGEKRAIIQQILRGDVTEYGSIKDTVWGDAMQEEADIYSGEGDLENGSNSPIEGKAEPS